MNRDPSRVTETPPSLGMVSYIWSNPSDLDGADKRRRGLGSPPFVAPGRTEFVNELALDAPFTDDLPAAALEIDEASNKGRFMAAFRDLLHRHSS